MGTGRNVWINHNKKLTFIAIIFQNCKKRKGVLSEKFMKDDNNSLSYFDSLTL